MVATACTASSSDTGDRGCLDMVLLAIAFFLAITFFLAIAPRLFPLPRGQARTVKFHALFSYRPRSLSARHLDKINPRIIRGLWAYANRLLRCDRLVPRTERQPHRARFASRIDCPLSLAVGFYQANLSRAPFDGRNNIDKAHVRVVHHHKLRA